MDHPIVKCSPEGQSDLSLNFDSWVLNLGKSLVRPILGVFISK